MLKMAKFCANLSFMFTEKPLLERYAIAKTNGFKAVESGFPFGYTLHDVKTAKESAGIDQILINIYTGDVSKGELGFAAIPGKEKYFMDSLLKTIEYAKGLNIPKIHIMAGKLENPPNQENDAAYENNLRSAVSILEKENIIGIIEPINNYSVSNYYLQSYEKAISVITKINSPNLRLMLDIFHLQHIRGDITNAIEKYFNYISHIQIAQVPNRNEPDTDGEINYRYVLKYLENKGYNDWIGLEYKPLTTSWDGLKWINNFSYTL